MIALVGFMLSPLSWWNDAFVNLPLAVAFAWGVSLLYRPAFEASLVVGYLLTNVLGFILLQKGAQMAASEKKRLYSRRELLKDAGISLGYTALLLLLVKAGVIKPIANYFQP